MAAKKGGRKGKSDIDSLPGRTQAATAGVRALGTAFDDLSKKGELSASSLNQMASAAAQAHPVLGLLASAAVATYRSFKLLEELELADSIKSFSATTNLAAIEFDIFSSRLEAGGVESGELKTTLEELAETNVLISERTRRWNDMLAEQTELVETAGAEEEHATSIILQNKRVLEEQLPGLIAKGAALEEQAEKLKKVKALEEAFAKRVKITSTLFEISERSTIERGGLLAASRDKQIRQQEFMLNQLRDLAAIEQEKHGNVLTWTAEEIAATESRIGRLKAEAETYREVGNMAQQAMLGAATGALNEYYDALDRTVSLNQIFAGGFDRAMRNVAAATIRSVGMQAAVRSIFELAEGFAALGTPGMQGLAAFHFKAAAIFGSIALAAGPAAGLTSVAPAGGYGGGGSGRGKGGGSDSGSGRTVNVNVTSIGTLDFEQKRVLAQAVQEAIAEGG